MARRILDVGDFANDGTGDSIRVAAIKLNETLAEVYNFFGNGSVLTFGTLTSSTTGNTVLGGDSFRVVGNTGQVSVGTDNPTVLFQVSSNSGVTTYTDQPSDVFKIEGNTDQGINISTGDSSNGYIAFSNTSTRAAGALGYDQGLNSLTIFTDNAERLRVDGSGNVGFGTASPLGRLHVENASDSAGWIVRGQTTSVRNESGLYVDASNNMELVARNGSGVLTSLIRSSGNSYFMGGNVGIGTENPVERLEVIGSARLLGTSTEAVRLEVGQNRTDNGFAYVDLIGDTTYDDYGARFIRGNTGPNATTQIKHRGGGNFSLIAEHSCIMQFNTDNSERMRITGNGKVGIGTSAPDSAFHVYKQINDRTARFQRISTQYLDIVQTASLTEIASSGKPFIISTGDVQPISFNTAGAERMRIDENGNVGIGTSTPTFKIDVHGPDLGQTSGDTSDLLQIKSSVSNASFLNFQTIRTSNGTTWNSAGTRIQQVIDVTKQGYIQFNGDDNDYGVSFGSNNTERMRIIADGNVGIGITSPSYKLHVAGTIHSTTGGFRFPDGSTQTTAGLEVANGKSIAFALIFG